MFLLPLSFYFRCACAPNATFQIVDEGEDRQNHFSAFSREYGEKKKLDKPNSWAISQFFLVLFPSFLTSKKAAEPTELKKSKHKTTKKTGRNIFFVKKLTNKFNNMSSRPHSPRSRSPDSRPSSRACKPFSHHCFHFKNDLPFCRKQFFFPQILCSCSSMYFLRKIRWMQIRQRLFLCPQ